MSFIIIYCNIVITVISIIFSLLFTACTILITSSDDDFICFFDEDGSYEDLIWTFKITLIALFSTLIYSLGLYLSTSYFVDAYSTPKTIWLQNKIFFNILNFLLSYSLIGTLMSINNSIKYSLFRVKYVKFTKCGDDPK
jgi:hypothetical protein